MSQYAIWPSELTTSKKPAEPKSLPDQLLDQAEHHEAMAEQYRGCSFYGEWPGSHHLRQAATLRQAAAALKAAEPPPKTPAQIAAESATEPC